MARIDTSLPLEERPRCENVLEEGHGTPRASGTIMRTMDARLSPTARLFLSRIASSLACLALVQALVHCGGTTAKSTGTGGHEAGTPEAGVVACGADGSCPTGSTCGFLIGSCAAKGQCVADNESTGTCNISLVFCGCGDAGAVYAGCSNYASAPTEGNQDCSIPTHPATAADGGPDSGALAACAVAQTTSPCPSACGANEICVQGPPPDIGCVADAGADSGLSCRRAAGSCIATATLGSGNACVNVLNTYCSSNGPGQPDGGAFGTVGVLPSGAFVVVCENDP